MPANTSISAPGRRRSGSQDMSNHWLQYRKRRDHSLLRMQLVNTLFLLIMIYSSAFIGDAQVIGHIGTNIALWLIPAGIIAAFLAIDITSPALSSMFSLDQLTSWTRIGQFLILIRMYRVMLMLMDELHMHSHYGGLCHGMPFGPMELAMTTIIDVSVFM